MKQREEWWKGSKFLQVDSLVCFVSSNGKIIFLSVCNPILPFHGRKDSHSDDNSRSDDIPSLFRQANRASVLLSLAEYKAEDAVWIGTHTAPFKTRQSLVEFPGVLLPSFQPTLQALQDMRRKLSLPFAEIVAPDSQTSAAIIKPPAYATKRGFSFNLDVLSGVPLTLTPGQSFDFTKLDGGSTLDEAQQFAVIQALSTGLALIQGPPGTGKSYTGVAIIKALLHNRKAADLGPIICVCYTNHALDQLLEHLVKDGVMQVIRLGSRSKSDLLQNLTLHHVREGVVPTKTEKHDKWEHNRDIGETLREIEDILSGLNNPKSWTNIQAHLMRTHNPHFRELFGKGVDKEEFQEVRGKKFRVVESWLRGAPKKLASNRPVAQLSAISLRGMSTSERGALHQHWIEQRSVQLTNDLIHALDSYHDSKSALDRCHMELDLRCLREAHIIGVTTSGLARNIELLQRVGAKVMLCEEVGEVLEAHTLTALLPGVEHVILIGDHEQLRPQINNYELQHDHPRGKGYSLDISLFERLVRPQMGNLQVPLSTLKTQRRMHPSISELVRVPLYPDLQDHPSVLEYPEVDGMRDRLYWLDHQEKEDPRPAQAVSLSKTNTFEVDMIAALVSHLVRQGTYGSEDIAVITPYLGQLQKIKKRLANSFEIVVGDRDQEELEAQGLQDDPETSGQVQVQKTTLLTQALKVQKNHRVLVETIQQLEKILFGSRDPGAITVSDLTQAFRILKNYQVLVEATQQLEKLLFGSGDAPIMASKILSRLSSEEMVLLSCTTTIDREDFSTLSDWQSSGYWFDEKEEEAFCRKFSYFMSGQRWDPRDIFGKWENFYKVLTQSIHMWGPKVCVKVWEADRDMGNCDYSEILRKIKHQHRHRTYEEEKMVIRNRSGSVIQWDLVGMRVTVDVLQRQ